MKVFTRVCLALMVLSLLGCGGGTPPVVIPPNPPPVNTDPNPPPNQNTLALIQSATSATVSAGLAFYAKDHPDEAAKIAKEIKDIVDTVVMPYLNGSTTGISSAAINAILTNNFAGLPQIAKDLITLAATLLDSYLPAPDPGTFLSDAQVAYVKAFFNGLSTGAGTVRSTGARAIEHRGGRWINLNGK